MDISHLGPQNGKDHGLRMAKQQDMSHKSVERDVRDWSVLPDAICPSLVQAAVTKYHRQVIRIIGIHFLWFWRL